MATDDLVLDAKKAALLELVMRQRSSAGIAAEGAPIPKRVIGRPVPLTNAQKRLAFLSALHPESSAYATHLAFDIKRPFSADRLEQAVRRVVAQHPPLRGVIDDASEPARLRLLEPATFRVERRTVAMAERDQALRTFAEQPTDTREDWPLRACVFDHEDGAFTLALAVLQLAADGEALRILVRDISQEYGRAQEPSDGKAEPAVNFLDYAAFLEDPRRKLQQAGHLSFWQTHLADLEPLQLPADVPRPVRSQLRGRTLEFTFSRDATLDIARLCSQQRVTKFMVLAAATAFVLSLASGREDVSFGTLVSDRERGPLASIVGCFMNTVVLRVPVVAGATVGDLLASVREATAAAIDHQGVPFDVLVQALDAKRSAASTPLVSVLFTHSETAPTPSFSLEGRACPHVPLEPQTAPLDLNIETWEERGILRGRVRYSTERFEHATAQRLVEQLEDTVALFREGAKRPLDTIVIRRGRAADMVGPQGPDSPPALLDRLREHAQTRPSQVAVRATNGTLSYAELFEEVANVCARLRLAGVDVGDRVGLMHHRTLGLLPWALGIWAVGGCYVPMDPELPDGRLGKMAADAAITALVCDDPHPERAEAVAHLAPILPAQIRSRPRCDDSARAWTPADPDRLAYLMFTSGTTGRPKGVEIQHGALDRLLLAMCSKPGCEASDVFVATASISFDMSIPELFLALHAGGCTAVAAEGTTKDPQKLAASLRDNHATLYCATPGAWKLLLEDGWDGRPGLRGIIGGEAVPADVGTQVRQRIGELFNMYGPTEATVWTGAVNVAADHDLHRGHLPIGGPLPQMRWVMLDRHDRRAVVGSPAELHLAGPMLARGYWRDRARTSSAFVPDPEDPQRRLYRTGDQVRLRNDGTLQFLGRRDRQLKLAGFRIEPGEIEVCLRSSVGVTDAAVTVQPGPDGRPALVAFVVVESPSVVDRLGASLREQLPASMIPAAITEVDAITRGTTGKVDLRALPTARWPSGSANSEPTGDTERRLLPIFCQLLSQETVARDANFFALGGHSLLALRLVRRVEHTLGLTVPLASFLAEPSIAGLARQIESPEVELPSGASAKAHPSAPSLAIVGFAAGAVALGAALPDDVNVIHLNPMVGWSPNDPDRPADLQQLSDGFARELLARASDGPVGLIGYCDDAKLATLVARRLEKLGGSVGFLGLVDLTFSSGDPTRGWGRYAHQLRRFGLSFAKNRAASLIATARQRVHDRVLLLKRRIGSSAAEFGAVQQHRLYVRSYYRALEVISPSPRGLHPHLFLSEEWAANYDRSSAYAAAEELKVSLLPGFHDRAFEGPAVTRLATLVHAHLQRT